jgi:hypothetical protein
MTLMQWRLMRWGAALLLGAVIIWGTSASTQEVAKPAQPAAKPACCEPTSEQRLKLESAHKDRLVWAQRREALQQEMRAVQAEAQLAQQQAQQADSRLAQAAEEITQANGWPEGTSFDFRSLSFQPGPAKPQDKPGPAKSQPTTPAKEKSKR